MAANIYVNEIELEPEECILHKGAKVNAICESCDEPVCLRCLLGSHNGHPIVDIQEARERVREELLSHRRVLRKEIKKMEAHLRDYTEKESENDRECGLALSNIRKRGKILQAQLTKLLQDLENEVKGRQEQNQGLISKYKDPLESQIKTASSKLNEIDISINSDNMYSTIHLKQELAKRSESQQNGHTEVNLQIPKFESRQTTAEDLCELLGHVVMCDDKPTDDAEYHEYDYVEPIQQKPKPSTKKKPSKKYGREPVPQIPPSHIKDDKYCEYTGTSSIMGFNNIRKTKLSDTQINSICPLTKNQAWTTDDSGKCLKLISEKGHTIRTVTANTKKSDIALTSDGAVLMTCPDKCCIKKYSQDGTIRIFINTPDYFPHGICIHFLTEEIFVGLIDADTYDVKSDSNRFIQRYSRKGEPLQQINIQKTSTLLSLPFTKKSPVVTIPHKVKVNQNTSEVGLVNWLRSGQGQVIVFTPEGKVKFTYPEDAKTPFEATDMVFTASNHIIVCDGVTRALHMLCPNGRFIKVLHTFDHVPASLAYFGNGLLWIGNGEGEINVSSFKE